MVARGQLADDSVDWLLVGVEDFGPALDMAFLNDVEKISDVACTHDDLTLVVPLRLKAVQQ